MGTKISALPAAGTLTGTEIVVMDQAGNTVTAPSGSMGIVARTTAESAAGVTPTNYAFSPGHILRYGSNANPGTTDMTVAFLNAIAQAQEVGGSAVYFPTGTYAVQGNQLVISGQIKFGGDGFGSKLVPVAGTTGVLLTVDSTNSPSSAKNIFGQLYGVTLEKFQIVDAGKRVQTVNGLRIQGVDWCTFRQIQIMYLNGYALKLDSALPVRESSFEDIYLYLCGNPANSEPQAWLHSPGSGTIDDHNELYFTNFHSVYSYERHLLIDRAATTTAGARFVFFNNFQIEGLGLNILGTSTGSISGISSATSAVVTFSDTSSTNPFVIGDTLKIAGVSGMTQINGLYGVVQALGGVSGAWTVTLNVNSSTFTAYTSGGTAYVSPALYDLVQVQAFDQQLVFSNGTSGNSSGWVSGSQAGYALFRLGSGSTSAEDVQGSVHFTNSYLGDGAGGVGVVMDSVRLVSFEGCRFGYNPGGDFAIGSYAWNTTTVTTNPQNYNAILGITNDAEDSSGSLNILGDFSILRGLYAPNAYALTGVTVNSTTGTITAALVPNAILEFTAITQLNNLAAGEFLGQEVTMYFNTTANATVVNGNSTGGAQLLLSGATNATVTPNSTLTLFYNGSSWVEKSRAIL